MLPFRRRSVSCVVAMLVVPMTAVGGDEVMGGGLDETAGFVVTSSNLNLIEIQWNGGLAE